MERLTMRGNSGLWCAEGSVGRDDEGRVYTEALDRLAAYEDTGLCPETVAQLKEIVRIFNCAPGDPAQLKWLCDKLRGWQQAEQDGRLVVANVSGRCGSCVHYKRIEGTARGACLKHPYGKDVICDPQMPYWVVGRSKLKCKLYEAAVKEVQGHEQN